MSIASDMTHALWTLPDKCRIQKLMLSALVGKSLICHELYEAAHSHHATASARLAELSDMGLVAANGPMVRTENSVYFKFNLTQAAKNLMGSDDPDGRLAAANRIRREHEQERASAMRAIRKEYQENVQAAVSEALNEMDMEDLV